MAASTASSTYVVRTENDEWYVDSGATQHLSSRKERLNDYTEIPPRNVYLADNRVIVAKGMGTVRLKLKVNGEERDHILQDVLHVPDLHGNLLSVSKIVACRFEIIFSGSRCIIKSLNGQTVAIATKEQSLYRLVATVQVHDKAHLTKVSQGSMALWHN
jgi:hypothetical protein